MDLVNIRKLEIKDNKAIAVIIREALKDFGADLPGTVYYDTATDDSGILFDVDSYSLKSETRNNLTKLSETMKKYDETEISLLGHTDNTGTEKYNAALSKKRAASVNDYLVTKGVVSTRLTDTGYGELDPIATNETLEGRELNRRVEIVIVADKKLQRAAKNGDITTN